VNPQEIDRPDLASGGFLNLERQDTRRPRSSVQDFRQMPTAYAKVSGQIGNRFLEGVRMTCHGTSVVCDTIKSRGNEIAEMSIPYDAVEMNTWPQRPRFKAAVLAYRKAHGLSPDEMAPLLDVSPSHLHGLLYDKRVSPSLDLVQKASEVLGMSITELADDPGSLVEGSGPEHSDFDRFMLKTMGVDLAKMTDAQKQAGFQVWKAFSDGILGK